MPKSEVAVIPMVQIPDDVKILFPPSTDPGKWMQLTALEPFDQQSVGFLDAWSKKLTSHPQIKRFPDVATFAFFCRKANILKLKDIYYGNEAIRLGRGLVFHITPSNVPVNFAWSLLSGILSGNVNIVRVPSKAFDQVDIICAAIAELSVSGNHKEITDRICLVRYDRQSRATSLFSSLCDVRIIWGGDETISDIRKHPLPPRAFDITFADRYSLCMIDADEYIREQKPEKIAEGFYNDTYLFDQNACTSPHLVIWTGSMENVHKSKEIFWENLHQVVQKKGYELQPSSAVDKLVAFYVQAIGSEGISKIISQDNLIWRSELDQLPADIDEFRCAGGYFAEYHAGSPTEIIPVINRKYQTLAYYGYSRAELVSLIREHKPSGIDRIVPIGRTSEFSLNWDGYDLIRTLSRILDVL